MILDKPSHLPVRKKLALLSHVGVLHAAKEDGVGVTARGARIMVGIMNPYSPVQNAMCKRWDTPFKILSTAQPFSLKYDLPLGSNLARTPSIFLSPV